MRENEVIFGQIFFKNSLDFFKKKINCFKKNLGVLRIKFSKNGGNRSNISKP
jgi:hypothetical protein